MATLRTIESWFITDMIRATTDMWLKGWDERNGGNISMRLFDRDVEAYLSIWKNPRVLPLNETLPELAGQYFLVTGSGKFFRNTELDPESSLGVIRILPSGEAIEVLWGYSDGGIPTSELSAHLKSHRSRQSLTPGRDRVIMHCHATNLIALSYVLELTTANITRALWEGSTECLVVFPEGVGTMDWMVPGTGLIGDATAELMARHPLALWPYHGVFGTGQTLDETFGLIDTAEKSAMMLVKIITMGGARQTLSTENLTALAKHFGVTPLESALALDGWRMAGDAVQSAAIALKNRNAFA